MNELTMATAVRIALARNAEIPEVVRMAAESWLRMREQQPGVETLREQLAAREASGVNLSAYCANIDEHDYELPMSGTDIVARDTIHKLREACRVLEEERALVSKQLVYLAREAGGAPIDERVQLDRNGLAIRDSIVARRSHADALARLAGFCSMRLVDDAVAGFSCVDTAIRFMENALSCGATAAGHFIAKQQPEPVCCEHWSDCEEDAVHHLCDQHLRAEQPGPTIAQVIEACDREPDTVHLLLRRHSGDRWTAHPCRYYADSLYQIIASPLDVQETTPEAAIRALYDDAVSRLRQQRDEAEQKLAKLGVG